MLEKSDNTEISRETSRDKVRSPKAIGILNVLEMLFLYGRFQKAAKRPRNPQRISDEIFPLGYELFKP